ncbi:MAG: hypothetical protein AB7E47_13420 [Desulfovibrionaceae bacterium]
MKRIVAIVCFVLFAQTAWAAGGVQPEVINSPAAVYEQGVIRICAESADNQSRFNAKLASKTEAQKALVEYIDGLRLVSDVTVQEGFTRAAITQTHTQGFLRGAFPVYEDYNKQEGYATTCMQINLRGTGSVMETLSPVLRNPPQALQVEKLPEYKPQPVAAAPAPKPVMAYDGLIIVVKGIGFQPALGQRIITERHEILFEPSKIVPALLVDRGCGGYTTTEDKAKALLATWGSQQPLVISGIRTVKGTEVVISEEDANTVFEQNQKAGIFSQAKVVFVL